jgi:hypothetical protein
MSISRYIVVAVVRCSRASWRLPVRRRSSPRPKCAVTAARIRRTHAWWPGSLCSRGEVESTTREIGCVSDPIEPQCPRGRADAAAYRVCRRLHPGASDRRAPRGHPVWRLCSAAAVVDGTHPDCARLEGLAAHRRRPADSCPRATRVVPGDPWRPSTSKRCHSGSASPRVARRGFGLRPVRQGAQSRRGASISGEGGGRRSAKRPLGRLCSV